MDEEFNKEQIENLMRSLGYTSDAFNEFVDGLTQNIQAQSKMAVASDAFANTVSKSANTLGGLGAAVTESTDTIKDNASATDKQTSAQRNQTTSVAKSTIATDQQSTALGDYTRQQKKAEEAVKAREDRLNKARGDAENALYSFGNALTSPKPSLNDFTSGIQLGTDSIAGLVEGIPILGSTISKLVKIMGALTGAAIEQKVQQIDFATEMRKMGVTTRAFQNEVGDTTVQTTASMAELARGAGYTAKKLIELSSLMAQAGPEIALFGGGMTEGSRSFMNFIKLTDDEQKAMRRLGYTYEETNEIQTQYLALQRASGINLKDQSLTTEMLKKRSLDYAKSLTVISELTGKSAESQMRADEAAQLEYRNQLANIATQTEINDLRRQAAVDGITEEEKADKISRAKTLENEMNSRTLINSILARTVSQKFAEQLNTVMRTSTFDESTKSLSLLGFKAEELGEIFKDIDPDTEDGQKEIQKRSGEILNTMITGFEKGVDIFGTALSLSGEEARSLGETLGLSQDKIDSVVLLMSKTEEERAAALAAAATDVDETTLSGQDTLQDAQALFEVTVRKMAAFADEQLNKINPLVMVAATAAIVAMGLAAGKAAISLSMIGGGKTGLLSKLGRLVGIGAPAAAGVATAAAAPVAAAGVAASPIVASTGAFLARNARAFRVGGGLAGAGVSAYQGYAHQRDEEERADGYLDEGIISQDERDRRETQADAEGTGMAVGGIGGAVAGGAAGAQAGAMLGVFGGPIGVALGATLGGLIGAGLGAWAGAKGGEVIGGEIGENITLTDEQQEQNTRQLELAKASGIYDKDIIGDSDIDWQKFEEMQAAGTLTPEMITAIIQDNDVGVEDEDRLTRVLAEMDKIVAPTEIETAQLNEPESEFGETTSAMNDFTYAILAATTALEDLSIRSIDSEETGLINEDNLAMTVSQLENRYDAALAQIKYDQVIGPGDRLDTASAPTVDITAKETENVELIDNSPTELATRTDNQLNYPEQQLKLLSDLGIMIGRLDSRMEEQNSLTEKIVQYSSV